MVAEHRAIGRLLQRREVENTGAYLERLSDRSVARSMRQLNRRDLVEVFDLLAPVRREEVFRLVQDSVRIELLKGLPTERSETLFASLDPDDRAWICHRVPDSLSETLLAALDRGARELTLLLMQYGPRSTGRVMSPHVLAVRAAQSVDTALELVRSQGEQVETVYMLPVVGDAGVVLGVVSLRRLMVSDPRTAVGDLMTAPAVVMRTDQDQEDAALSFRDARLIAAPVVDADGRLAGVLTVDDAMRILEEANAEDAARGSGSERLRRSYPATSVLDLVRSRVGWLLVLIVAATLTVNVLDYFEETLAQVVVLALFVPLLIGTGGNVGAQSATTVVRAMAVGDVGPGDFVRVLLREVGTGLLLGLILAAVGFFPATFFADRSIAIVVCLSLIAICVLASGVGSTTPMIARRIGIDPAVVSAPFISTIVDATGLVVYFLVARAVLGLG